MRTRVLLLLVSSVLSGCIAPQTFEYYRAENPAATKELRNGLCPPYALYDFAVDDGVLGTIQAAPVDKGIGFSLRVSLDPGKTFRLTLPYIIVRAIDSETAQPVLLDRFNVVTHGRVGKPGYIQYYDADTMLEGLDRDAKHVAPEAPYSRADIFATSGLLPAAPSTRILVSFPSVEVGGKLRHISPVWMELVRKTVLVSQCG